MNCFDRKDLGLLVLRAGVGGLLAAHGAQKLLGWFGGGGVEGTAEFMESVGYSPGKPNAVMAGVGEAGGGLLLALGLATPAAGGLAMGTMAGASSVNSANGFWATQGGYEYPAALGLVSAALCISGPGRLSLDHALGHHLNRRWMVPLALAATAAGTAGVICQRMKNLREKQGEDSLEADPTGE